MADGSRPAVWFASYIVMVLPLSRRLVEILCPFFFIVAIIVWIDILPLGQWAKIAYERFIIRQ